MKVIVPCCGRSSRYPNQPPKWMLPSHDGRPMVSLAVSGVDFDLADLVVVVLREHDERFQVVAGLKSAVGAEVNVVVLEKPTASQPDTVAQTLRALDLDEPFLVKDSDNVFTLPEPEQNYNYLCVESLNHFEAINPKNKSYVQIDHNGVVTNIREKVVISDLFSVGGYYFTSPKAFLEYFDRLAGDAGRLKSEIYVSDVIGAMILDGAPFRAREITGYQDWGTVHEWRRSLLARTAYFLLVDGFLFERGSEYFRPRFADVQPNPEAIETALSLHRLGHTLIYLSIRPASLAELTRKQLEDAGLPPGQVVHHCPIGSWVLVTAPHPTLPFLTSHALEVRPDDQNVCEKVLGEHDGRH